MTASLRILLVALALGGSTTLSLARGPEGEPGAGPSALPAATGLFRHVTAAGTTKPEGAALDGRLGTSPRLAAADLRLGLALRTAICRGC